jgi:hypothetical protein
LHSAEGKAHSDKHVEHFSYHYLKNKKPIPFENRLKFDPKFFVEDPTPRRVGYTLPKIRKNSKNNREILLWLAFPML